MTHLPPDVSNAAQMRRICADDMRLLHHGARADHHSGCDRLRWSSSDTITMTMSFLSLSCNALQQRYPDVPECTTPSSACSSTLTRRNESCHFHAFCTSSASSTGSPTHCSGTPHASGKICRCRCRGHTLRGVPSSCHLSLHVDEATVSVVCAVRVTCDLRRRSRVGKWKRITTPWPRLAGDFERGRRP